MTDTTAAILVSETPTTIIEEEEEPLVEPQLQRLEFNASAGGVATKPRTAVRPSSYWRVTDITEQVSGEGMPNDFLTAGSSAIDRFKRFDSFHALNSELSSEIIPQQHPH